METGGSTPEQAKLSLRDKLSNALRDVRQAKEEREKVDTSAAARASELLGVGQEQARQDIDTLRDTGMPEMDTLIQMLAMEKDETDKEQTPT